MEFFILIDYTENKVIEVGKDFSIVIKCLNQHLNRYGQNSVLPDLLKQELKLKSQIEIKAGNKLLAVAVVQLKDT